MTVQRFIGVVLRDIVGLALGSWGVWHHITHGGEFAVLLVSASFVMGPAVVNAYSLLSGTGGSPSSVPSPEEPPAQASSPESSTSSGVE